MTSITFHGAADTVTGSRHLLETGGKKVLVDCGLFQGPKEIRNRNWERFPVDPGTIDEIVITHAHLDHTGYLPRLVKQGYGGPIHCTPATRDLMSIMLLDSARLQMEEAEHANKHKWSKHKPALPLYDETDVRRTLKQLQAQNYEQPFEAAGTRFTYQLAGHILGSAFAFAETEVGLILFSGDLGRFGQSIIPDPTAVQRADYLLVESTYGDRDHQDVDVLTELQRIVERAVRERGWILIPSFAIGRAQEVLYLLNELWTAGRIERLPVFLDSPMAVSALSLFIQHTEDHDLEMTTLMTKDRNPLEGPNVHFIRTRDESKALNEMDGPGIIIAGSGMANGGRIRHHLVNRVDNPRTTVLFVGYQGVGTPGRALLEGAEKFRAFGWEVPVRARMERLDALSAHADRGEILRWLGGFEAPPKRTFLVHGEPVARKALEEKITTEIGWSVYRPGHGERVELA
jgi:metallo-beta-lactamase family protein